MRTTIVQLESSARSNQRKMRDLENQVHILRGKLRTAERAVPPRLPVEVLEPEAPPAEAAPPAASSPDGYDVAGFDEDGVEIVYVGDAAQEHSVRPDPLPPAWNTPAAHTTPPKDAPAPPSASQRELDSAEIFDTPDRLEVTDRVGPTVARQLREARPPAMPHVEQPAPVDDVRSPTKEAARPAAADPRAQYQRYYDALKAGNHTYAITGFRNFIARFPGHDYADNARYWLAEAFYDKREYRAALAEFLKVVQDYPQGNKVPDALLKIGFCHMALGDHAEARSALLRVVEMYPNSKPAALAVQRLDRLAHN